MITDTERDNTLLEYYQRGILKQEVRSYEVSLWTLQDEFITVLKWSDVEQRGRIEQPKMTLNIDGTQHLTFSIPMYYREKGKLIENPNWYNTQNGYLIIGLRKLKVIFNKGTEYDEVFEFVITSVKEKHEEDILTCEIEAEGLAFQELGKIGYKLNLSTDNFAIKHNEWSEKGRWTKRDGTRDTHEPLQTVKYWCEEEIGLTKWDENNYNSTTWYYDIQMDWSSFAGGNSNRESDKVYEEPYVTSWESGTLIPTAIENYREKARPISAEKSNIYNITQTIAEKFEIFCRYEYGHDENYHIISRKIVFYNNFTQEEKGYLGFIYPYSLSTIERSMDDTNTTTKLFILNPDDDTSVQNAAPNDTREDYILNFDYLYDTHAITKEQYNEIQPYKKRIRALNDKIIAYQEQKWAYELQLPELQAKQAIYKKSIDLDKEQILQNNALYTSLDSKDGENDGYIALSGANADFFTIMTKDDGAKYIHLGNTNKGIVEDTIQVFTTMHTTSQGTTLSNKIEGYKLERDDYGNLTNLVLTETDQLSVTDIDWAGIFKNYYVPSGYIGNVDLSHRIIVPGDTIRAAGYDEQGDYGTLLSSSFTPCGENDSPLASDGKYYDIIFTPIMADGTVLKPGDGDEDDKIYHYLDTIIAQGTSPKEWMAADKKQKGLLLHYIEIQDLNDHNAAVEWTDTLHRMQAEWDTRRAANNWFGYEANPGNVSMDAFTPITYEFCEQATIDTSYTKTTTTTSLYLTYKYKPKLYYENIVETWRTKLYKDRNGYEELTLQIGPESETDKKFDLSAVYEYYADYFHLNLSHKKYDQATPNEKARVLVEAYNNGLNKLLVDVKNNIDRETVNKQKEIAAFERLMGPALREGYWQPEDYNDYGDHHEYIDSLDLTANDPETDIIVDSEKSAIIAWDSKLFDDEDKLYYETSVLQTKVYFPCIDLIAVFGSVANIPYDLEDYSVVWWANNLEEPPETAGDSKWDSLKDIQQAAVDSSALIKFIFDNNTVKPVLMINGAQSMTDDQLQRLTSTGQAHLEKFSAKVNDAGTVEIDHGETQYPIGNHWIAVTNNTKMVYPRIKFSDISLKADTTNLVIHYNDVLLQEYNDYRINTRNTERDNKRYPEYYITIKPEVLIKQGIGHDFKVNYVFSNANTAIYLDALQVSKENAKPQVSYDVSVSVMNISLLHELYRYLARIVMINDTDLKFENVFGYISGLELDLDNCANDTIEVKNYKTKFEDLFSTIVAQTEAMKQGGSGFAAAAAGNVPLSENGISQTLAEHTDILNAYFDSYFDSSEVVRQRLTDLFNEAGKILSSANKSLNSVKTATLENADILSGLAEDVAAELTTTVFRQPNRPEKFEQGDIWIRTNEENTQVLGRYMAIMSSSNLQGESNSDTRGFVRTYDGSLASITGANVEWDAVTGVVDITGQSAINIRSGNSIYIAANENVDILGNSSVNIGGSEINLCSLYEKEINEDGSLTYKLDGQGNKILQETSGINLIAGEYSQMEDGTISKVLISPHKLELGSASILMKAASRITLLSSTGTTPGTAAITIDADKGVWIGSGNSVRLFSGSRDSTQRVFVGPQHPILFEAGDVWIKTSYVNGHMTYDHDPAIDNGTDNFYTSAITTDLDGTHSSFTIDGRYLATASWDAIYENTADAMTGRASTNGWTRIGSVSWGSDITNAKGASVELNSEHLIMGYYNTQIDSGSAIELDQEKIVLAVGSATVNSELEITGVSGGLVGAKLTKDSIGFATSYSENNVTKYNAILMNGPDGITIGSGSVNVTVPTVNDPNKDTSNGTLRASTGSYVRISGEGIELGSLADLYINTNNFKLQSGDYDAFGNALPVTDLGTRFAVGNNLHLLTKENNHPANGTITNDDVSNISGWVGIVYNKSGLFVNGNVYATSFTAQATSGSTTIGYFKATGSNLGFYDSSNNSILTINNNGEIVASKKLSITAENLYIGGTPYTDLAQAVDNNQIIESLKMYRTWNSTTVTTNIFTGSGTTTADTNWHEQVPAPTSEAPYIWSITRYKKKSGVYSYSTPVYEQLLTNSQATTYYKFKRTNSTTAPTIVDLDDLNTNWFLEVPTAVIQGTSSTDAKATLPYVWRTKVTVKVGQTPEYTSPPERASDYEGISNAAIKAINVANGYTAVPYVDTTDIVIKEGTISIKAQAAIKLTTNQSLTFTTSSGNNAMIFDDDGISIGTAKSIGLAANGTITILTENLILDSNAANDVDTTKSIFELKKLKSGSTTEYDTALKYSIEEGLEIASDVKIGGQTLTQTISANLATIGGWTIGQNTISSGENNAQTGTSTAVYLNSDASDSYAIWAGNTSATDALFRVKRNGSVYLNSLMVLDVKDGNTWGLGGTDADHEDVYTDSNDGKTYGYKPIDFSKLNFKQAVSLTGSWSGNTLNVRCSLWGVLNKTVPLTASFNAYNAQITSHNTGQDYVVSVKVECTVNGTSGEDTITGIHLNCTQPYRDGWNACKASMLNSAQVETVYTGTPGTAYDAPHQSANQISVIRNYSSKEVTYYTVPGDPS